MMTNELKEQVKSDNEKIISSKGYAVNSWLPVLETTPMRSPEEIKGRLSVMVAMVNISFGAPTDVIKEWIEEQHLTKHLSAQEKQLVNKDDDNVTDMEVDSLRWYLEGIWALLWVLKMNDNLDPGQHVGDSMASLVPNLQRGDKNDKINAMQDVQNEQDVYTMLDYYYRLHWYCVEERLNGKQPPLNEGLVYERRKALKWVLDKHSGWDDIEMGT